jgi:hypothetical protein
LVGGGTTSCSIHELTPIKKPTKASEIEKILIV